MQHISIDFAHTWPSSFTRFDSCRPARIDSTIANHICRINAKCLSLRSFTLHILADPGFMPVVEGAIDVTHSATASALMGLDVLKHKSIVVLGGRGAFKKFRKAMHPGFPEMETHFLRWPEVSMAGWQLYGGGGAGLYYGRRDMIREWHSWPRGTEALWERYLSGKSLGFVGRFKHLKWDFRG